uniref:PilW family protein n=1 Tax=Pseudomonas laurentiana TaxID=2364649 RepID=UPI0029C946E2|nr:prepilin-type N-terminal cleavage/methylation domain-containing protein [Pseudomonas laurentiana]
MKGQAGFSLLESLVALSIGVLLMLASSRVFMGAIQVWQAQALAAHLQEDARFLLLRMARDIRMAGMAGCLRHEAITFADASTAERFRQPLRVERAPDGSLRALSLIAGESGETGGPPDWTLVTDCLTTAHVYPGVRSAGAGQIAMPIRRQTYRLEGRQLLLSSGGSRSVLIDNVSALRLMFDPAAPHELHLSLTLSDPHGRVAAQTYELTAAPRNRLF